MGLNGATMFLSVAIRGERGSYNDAVEALHVAEECSNPG